MCITTNVGTKRQDEQEWANDVMIKQQLHIMTKSTWVVILKLWNQPVVINTVRRTVVRFYAKTNKQIVQLSNNIFTSILSADFVFEECHSFRLLEEPIKVIHFCLKRKCKVKSTTKYVHYHRISALQFRFWRQHFSFGVKMT